MLVDTLRCTINDHNPPLIVAGDRVLVAVSGGPDSLALLHALIEMRGELQIDTVTAAHLDHGLRGEESAADSDFVQGWCKESQIPCIAGCADTTEISAAAKITIQEAARRARYAFLDQVAAGVGASKIATAHTLEDRVETVLLNILRGTGLDGLKGIPYRREVPSPQPSPKGRRSEYVRPLLNTSRADVLTYCEAAGLTPRQDPSNLATDHYTRNKIRLELLPILERDYNMGVRASLLRLSEIAARDSDYLHAQALSALQTVMLEKSDAALTLDARKLRALHPALLRHVLRVAIETVRQTPANLPYEHIEQICAAIETPPASPFGITTSPPHCAIRVTQRRVRIVVR